MKRILGCLALLWLFSTPSAVRAVDFGYYGWDARAGVALPSDWDTGYTLGFSVDISELYDGLFLFPGVRYSRAEDSDFGLEITDIAVGAEVRYFLDEKQSGWYFGGGPYFHVLDYDQHVGFGIVASSSATRVGPAGVAGYRWNLESMSILFEARYDVVSNFNRGEVLVGISFGGGDQ